MSWNSKYWDILDQLYWWPRYLGLRSISQKNWQKKDGMVCVPAELVNNSGPLYSRERKSADLVDYLHGSEEILNHLFDITFSIAPDSMVNDLLLAPLGFSDSGPFESIGRESSKRYGWGVMDNVTQHDGLFVSAQSAIGVELKLLSSSWPEQIAKYAALLTLEELVSGPRQQLGLLYIVPDAALKNHWHNCGLAGPVINRSFLDTQWQRKLPKVIANLFENHREHVASVLDRIKLGIITWEKLRQGMVTIQESLDLTHRGDQTLDRLISGFVAQLDAHRDTGITHLGRPTLPPP
jgi:hypothetical protein